METMSSEEDNELSRGLHTHSMMHTDGRLCHIVPTSCLHVGLWVTEAPETR